jgi:hypothetical protein
MDGERGGGREGGLREGCMPSKEQMRAVTRRVRERRVHVPSVKRPTQISPKDRIHERRAVMCVVGV